ncbi:DUF6449 domain-containing protein [Anaerocolumna xylanovorans]|uniref:ABC-2 type transport system permease protein n=1 Tax=Anaerocolumna xylanovorans DSM 12503 TaxID=1121345 RepID=A0A1M7XZ31_9FIRM|nr:DUF6449 domain-containing protein [Anaerocolumna xylanovorans]SHO44383.1 ABC-2 type transport system permease protein [Anaerocolumna xylanovorans DSM 12503]
MTSRNLFFKLQKEDIKRRMWVAALSMLVFFLFGPIWLALTMESMTDIMGVKYLVKEMSAVIGPGFILQYLIAIAGALICACSGYFYLHSKKKVDFFHSVPVKRETLFLVNFFDGILLYFLPYFISMILNFVVLFTGGYLRSGIVIAGFQALLVNLLYFLLLYTLTVLAIMLTGNGIVSLLGIGVFFAYGPFIMAIKDMYCHEFFKTYLLNSNESRIFEFLSPIGKYIYKSQQIKNGNYDGIALSILMTAAVILLLLVFSLILYKKRPSEAAGKAMAFGIAKPIIKFLLIIPITLGGGMIFRNAANVHSDGWMIFGLLLIFLIFGAIIEIIYQFDLKKAFTHRKGLAVYAFATAVIVCIFRFDLISYDTYLPDKDRVASMSIGMPDIDSGRNFLEINQTGTGYTYNSAFQYEIKYMRLKDFDAAYEIAKLGMKESKKTEEGSDKSYSAMVAFHLKNGRTVIRNYAAVYDKDLSLVKQVYENSDFKEGHYPIYRWKNEYITSVSAYNSIEEKYFTLTEAETAELLAIYKEELKTLTIDEIIKGKPLATLRFTLIDGYSFEYHIFPEFTKTKEFLSAHGFQNYNQTNAKDIKKIIVMKQTENQDTIYLGDKNINDKGTEIQQADYTGKDQIGEIFQAAIPAAYCDEFRGVLSPDYDFTVKIIFNTDSYGNETVELYYFSKNNIPDFVLKDLH